MAGQLQFGFLLGQQGQVVFVVCVVFGAFAAGQGEPRRFGDRDAFQQFAVGADNETKRTKDMCAVFHVFGRTPTVMPRRGLKTKNDRALLLARRDGAGCTFVQGHAVVHFGLGHVHDVDGTVGFKWVDDLSIFNTGGVRQCKTSVPGRNPVGWVERWKEVGKRWKENSKGTAKEQQRNSGNNKQQGSVAHVTQASCHWTA